MTPGGIEPATFRFVAQHLNHCATAVPAVHMEQHITSAPAEVVEVGSQPGLTRLVNPGKEEGILGTEVGLHGNMKV